MESARKRRCSIGSGRIGARYEPSSLDLQRSRSNPLGDRVFDEKSLYAKILDKTLRSENVHAGNKAFYRSRVDRVVSGWDRELGLSSKQHDRSGGADRAGDAGSEAVLWRIRSYAVSFQAARLPKERLAANPGRLPGSATRTKVPGCESVWTGPDREWIRRSRRTKSGCTIPGGRASWRAEPQYGSDGASPSQNHERPFAQATAEVNHTERETRQAPSAQPAVRAERIRADP